MKNIEKINVKIIEKFRDKFFRVGTDIPLNSADQVTGLSLGLQQIITLKEILREKDKQCEEKIKKLLKNK